jgi:hypothetical protein
MVNQKMFVFLIVFVGSANALTGGAVCPGNCTPDVQNFTVDQISGIWFRQIATSNRLWDNSKYKCQVENYTKTDSYSVFLEVKQQEVGTNKMRATSGFLKFDSEGYALFSSDVGKRPFCCFIRIRTFSIFPRNIRSTSVIKGHERLHYQSHLL